MKNNKRNANFGWAAGRHKNLVMERRARRIRVGSIVEVKTDAYLNDWVLDQIGGRRGTVVKIKDIGWETDHLGRRYISGWWDALVSFNSKTSSRKIYGLDDYKLNVISPRQLRRERLQRNRDLRLDLNSFYDAYNEFVRWSNDYVRTVQEQGRFI